MAYVQVQVAVRRPYIIFFMSNPDFSISLSLKPISTKLHILAQFLTANLLDHELDFLVYFRVQKIESRYNRTWQSHLTLRTRQLLPLPPPQWKLSFCHNGGGLDECIFEVLRSKLWLEALVLLRLAVWWRKQLLSSLESTMYCYFMGLAIPRNWTNDIQVSRKDA